MTYRILIFCCLVCFAGGCATPAEKFADRERAIRAAFPAATAETVGLIARREIAQGFTTEMVRAALGAPRKVRPSETPDGFDQWHYRFAQQVGGGLSGTSMLQGRGDGLGLNAPSTHNYEFRVAGLAVFFKKGRVEYWVAEDPFERP